MYPNLQIPSRFTNNFSSEAVKNSNKQCFYDLFFIIFFGNQKMWMRLWLHLYDVEGQYKESCGRVSTIALDELLTRGFSKALFLSLSDSCIPGIAEGLVHTRNTSKNTRDFNSALLHLHTNQCPIRIADQRNRLPDDRNQKPCPSDY